MQDAPKYQLHDLIQSINQSKRIYIAPYVAGESETHLRYILFLVAMNHLAALQGLQETSADCWSKCFTSQMLFLMPEPQHRRTNRTKLRFKVAKNQHVNHK